MISSFIAVLILLILLGMWLWAGWAVWFKGFVQAMRKRWSGADKIGFFCLSILWTLISLWGLAMLLESHGL